MSIVRTFLRKTVPSKLISISEHKDITPLVSLAIDTKYQSLLAADRCSTGCPCERPSLSQQQKIATTTCKGTTAVLSSVRHYLTKLDSPSIEPPFPTRSTHPLARRSTSFCTPSGCYGMSSTLRAYHNHLRPVAFQSSRALLLGST